MKPTPLIPIEVTHTSTDTITRKIYNVTYDGEPYIYIDFYNGDDKIVDTILRDVYGNNIDNADVLQEIVYVIDQQLSHNNE